MAIYPKNNKVRSFSIGGALQSAFDTPATYVGLQYIPRKADIPSLDALALQMKGEQEAQQTIATAAAKQQVDETRIDELKKEFKNKSLIGEGDEYFGQLSSLINTYKSRYGNSNDIFSKEARQELARISSFVSTENLNRLATNRDTFDSDGKKIESNQTGDNIAIKGGKIYLQGIDANGNPKVFTEPVDAAAFYKAQSEGKYEGLGAMTINEFNKYQMYNKNFSSGEPIITFGSQKSQKQAVEEINEAYKQLGSDKIKTVKERLDRLGVNIDGNTKDIPIIQKITQSTKSNDKALQYATLALDGLISQEAIDAITGNLIQRGMVADVLDMRKTMGEIIGNVAGSNRIYEYEEGLDTQFIPGLGKGKDGTGNEDSDTNYIYNFMAGQYVDATPDTITSPVYNRKTGKVEKTTTKTVSIPINGKDLQSNFQYTNITANVHPNRQLFLNGIEVTDQFKNVSNVLYTLNQIPGEKMIKMPISNKHGKPLIENNHQVVADLVPFKFYIKGDSNEAKNFKLPITNEKGGVEMVKVFETGFDNRTKYGEALEIRQVSSSELNHLNETHPWTNNELYEVIVYQKASQGDIRIGEGISKKSVDVNATQQMNYAINKAVDYDKKTEYTKDQFRSLFE